MYRYCNLSRFFDSDVIKNRTLDQTNKQFLWKVPWIHQLTILFTFFMDGPLDSPDEAGLLLQPKLRTALGGKIDGWINFPLFFDAILALAMPAQLCDYNYGVFTMISLVKQ